MKLISLLLFIALMAGEAAALPNPAAVYCERLGFEYKKVQTPAGAKGMVVVKPGVEFDAWDFFKGKVGNEYSFGALYGYDTECVCTNIGTYMAEYAVCVSKAAKGQKNGVRIPLQALMEQKGVPLFDEAIDGRKQSSSGAMIPANREEDMFAIYDVMDQGKMIPTSFDWRTNSSHAYIGAVRDQGSCGSCYAFAAAAAAEGTYNWAMGKYDADCVDYSESFIIWCLGRMSPYSDHFFGCDGADWDYAELTALVAEGICLEADFPYTESDPGSCAHWADPLTVFSSWHRVPCGDIDAIKTAIMTYGVVDAAVYVSGSFAYYDSGIYTDTNTNCDETPCYYKYTNHAIALVGWDDNPPEGGGGCWILRNSWDTSWGEDGYMRLRYNAARVACEVCYMIFNDVASLAAPANLAASDGTYTNKVAVTWSALTNASGYQVWRAEANNAGAAARLCNVTQPGYDDTSSAVRPATMYYYWVKAWNNAATSEFSNVDSGFCRMSADPAIISGQPMVGDYDGDGRADPAVYNLANGQLSVWLTSAGYTLVTPTVLFQMAVGDLPVVGDFDGDRRADPGVFQRLTGSWYIWLSSAEYYRVGPLSFGVSINDTPIPADYDGDQLADPAVFNGAAAWYVWLSSADYLRIGPMTTFRVQAADMPAPAQFDADRQVDPAVYQAASGNWYVWLSSADYFRVGPITCGTTGEHLSVPADYDGDGLADPAVYVPSNGVWRIWISGNDYSLIELSLH